MLKVIGLLMVLAWGIRVQGGNLTSVFIAGPDPVIAGSESSLWLCSMNDSPAESPLTFPPAIPCPLTSASRTTNIILSLKIRKNEQRPVIRPHQFVKEEYSFTVPPGFGGRAQLQIDACNQILTMDVREAPAPKAPPSVASKTPGKPAASNTTPLAAVISNNILTHIFGYEPIYFLLGSYPAAEFQYSVKYKILNLANDQNPLGHLYFAFTQTSYWDLISPDPSFYDSSYKPSVFLYFTNVLADRITDRLHFELQGGAEHESNGRGGAEERSLYTAYLQPTATINLPCHFDLSLQPRVRAYFWKGHNNPDIADYRGYADLLAALTWHDPKSDERIQFSTKLLIGEDGSHPGLKFDLRFNLAMVPYLQRFNPTIQIQYFTGYGQTLRQYNQSSHSFRAGLCLWY